MSKSRNKKQVKDKLIELTEIIEKEINRLGIDSLLDTPDYVLAESCLHTLIEYSRLIELTKKK